MRALPTFYQTLDQVLKQIQFLYLFINSFFNERMEFTTSLFKGFVCRETIILIKRVIYQNHNDAYSLKN